MKSPSACEYSQSSAGSSTSPSNDLNVSASMRLTSMTAITSTAPANLNQTPSPLQQHPSDMARSHDDNNASAVHSQHLQCQSDTQPTPTAATMQQHSPDQTNTETTSNAMQLMTHHHNPLQNMMHNVLSHNPLINLTNITPMLNPMQSHVNQSLGSNELHVIAGQEQQTDGNHSLNSPELHHSAMVRHHMATAHNLNRIVHATDHNQAAHQHSAELTGQNVSDMDGNGGTATGGREASHHSMQTESFKLEQI